MKRTARAVIGAALLLVALAGCSRTTEQQLRRVTIDGQECVVVERSWGKVEGVDCDWSGR